MAARAKSYRVLKITGKDAQHSKLHNNAQVDKALINFLWGKYQKNQTQKNSASDFFITSGYDDNGDYLNIV